MPRDGYPEYTQAIDKRKTEIIDQRQKELEKNRPGYLAAKNLTRGRTDRDEVVRLATLLKSYHPGDPGEKAIFIVAQAAILISELVAPFAVVTNYEAKEEEVKKIRQ